VQAAEGSIVESADAAFNAARLHASVIRRLEIAKMLMRGWVELRKEIEEEVKREQDEGKLCDLRQHLADLNMAINRLDSSDESTFDPVQVEVRTRGPAGGKYG
jgi:hypothetical protein